MTLEVDKFSRRLRKLIGGFADVKDTITGLYSPGEAPLESLFTFAPKVGQQHFPVSLDEDSVHPNRCNLLTFGCGHLLLKPDIAQVLQASGGVFHDDPLIVGKTDV